MDGNYMESLARLEAGQGIEGDVYTVAKAIADMILSLPEELQSAATDLFVNLEPDQKGGSAA